MRRSSSRVKLLVLFTSLSFLSTPIPNAHAGKQNFEANAYVSVLRILDRADEAAAGKSTTAFSPSIPSLLNFAVTNGWAADAPGCMIAGWRGEMKKNGCQAKAADEYQRVLATCPANPPQTSIPCNPELFGSSVGCAYVPRSDQRWTRACSEKLFAKVGAGPKAITAEKLSETDGEKITDYLNKNPGRLSRAVDYAGGLCISLKSGSSDRRDCESVRRYLTRLEHATTHDRACPTCSITSGNQVQPSAETVGRSNEKNIRSINDELKAADAAEKTKHCAELCEPGQPHCWQAIRCRSNLLEAQMRKDFAKMLRDFDARKSKRGFRQSNPFSIGNCSLELSYQHYHPSPRAIRVVLRSRDTTVALDLDQPAQTLADLRAYAANGDGGLVEPVLRDAAYRVCFAEPPTGEYLKEREHAND